MLKLHFFDQYTPTCPIIVLNWLFYAFFDQFAPTLQVIALDWAFYRLLDQFLLTWQVVVWWMQFTLKLIREKN
jgi:hypothetical protein